MCVSTLEVSCPQVSDDSWPTEFGAVNDTERRASKKLPTPFLCLLAHAEIEPLLHGIIRGLEKNMAAPVLP